MSTATLHSEKKKVLTPHLRFKEFVEFWKETLLNDVAEFRKGKGISKSDIIDDGNLECIRYGELYTTYNELIVDIVSKTNLPLKSLELSEYNDVIIPASGETQLDIATASCVLKSGVALSGDLNIIRSSLNGIFLSFYLNNKKKLEIAKLAQGSSVVHLYSSQLKSLKLNIPTLPEQQKIAFFLSAVDEKIQQLSRKKELLSQYKKGVMQQLFSGKLRFKDENGKDYADWEEKKLGEVCDVRDGTHDSPKYVDKGFAFITSKNLMKDGSIDFDNVSFINEINYNKVNQRSKVNINDILFGMIGTIGNPVLVKSEGFAIKNVALIKEKQELLNFFLIHFLKGDSINQQFFEQNTGGTQKFLSLSVIRNLSVIVPSIKEQQKIATFLSSIDTKIESTNQQLNQTQSFKKGLLQQLFV